MIFFTADTHFGHKNVIKFCRRPFESIDEMDHALISNWNNVVGDDDIVYHLGDFSLCSTYRAVEILGQLNGRIHLINGNHDAHLPRHIKNKFLTCTDFEHICLGDGSKQYVSLFHYPIESWEMKNYGAWHLHGHCHGKLSSEGILRLDVGVDCHNYTPISAEQIREYFKIKQGGQNAR